MKPLFVSEPAIISWMDHSPLSMDMKSQYRTVFYFADVALALIDHHLQLSIQVTELTGQALQKAMKHSMSLEFQSL